MTLIEFLFIKYSGTRIIRPRIIRQHGSSDIFCLVWPKSYLSHAFYHGLCDNLPRIIRQHGSSDIFWSIPNVILPRIIRHFSSQQENQKKKINICVRAMYSMINSAFECGTLFHFILCLFKIMRKSDFFHE